MPMSKKLLVVVDVQKDFVEGGALPYGYPTESNTKKVLDFVRDWCMEDNALSHYMIATKDTHGEDYSSTMEGSLLPVPHCIKGSVGWQYADSTPDRDGIGWFADDEILKPTFGTFRIKEWVENFEKEECEPIDEIHIIGYDLAICVLANAVILRAAFPNKRIIVHKDLCGCVNEDTFKAALTVLSCQQIEIV